MLVVLAGCGRLGFGSYDPATDAPALDAYVIPGTIAHYPMDDDPSDGVIDDTSGGRRPARGVAGGSCPTQIAGKAGKAIHFDGTTQQARITNDAVFASPGAFTIALWVYLDDPAADRVAVAKPLADGSDDSWGFVSWTTAMTCFETTITTFVRHNACSTFTTPGNRWVHYAGVFDGVEKQLYVDGVRVGQYVSDDVVAFDNHDIIIGGDENGGQPAYQWKGGIDELYIFDRALTGDEIAKLAAP